MELFILFCFIFGLGLISLGVYNILRKHIHTLQVDGIVKKLDCTRPRRCILTTNYNVSNKEYIQNIEVGTLIKYREGDNIKLSYNPNNPMDIIIYNNTLYVAIMLIIFGISVILVGVYDFYNKKV